MTLCDSTVNTAWVVDWGVSLSLRAQWREGYRVAIGRLIITAQGCSETLIIFVSFELLLTKLSGIQPYEKCIK